MGKSILARDGVRGLGGTPAPTPDDRCTDSTNAAAGADPVATCTVFDVFDPVACPDAEEMPA